VVKDILQISHWPETKEPWQSVELQHKGTRKQKMKLYLAVTVIVYSCWMERNQKLFKQMRQDLFHIVIDSGKAFLNRIHGIAMKTKIVRICPDVFVMFLAEFGIK